MSAHVSIQESTLRPALPAAQLLLPLPFCTLFHYKSLNHLQAALTTIGRTGFNLCRMVQSSAHAKQQQAEAACRYSTPEAKYHQQLRDHTAEVSQQLQALAKTAATQVKPCFRLVCSASFAEH